MSPENAESLERVTVEKDYHLRAVDVVLSPPQPDEVEQAVEQLLEAAPAAPDPWWQAGVDEALET